MEDFLELAKENTDKDLETCGNLGAFLVRLMLSLYILEPEIYCHPAGVAYSMIGPILFRKFYPLIWDGGD